MYGGITTNMEEPVTSFKIDTKGETVEDEKYLIVVTRYIHQNPAKAKIVTKAEDYKWSSYKDYIASYNGKTTKIDTELIMSYFIAQDSFEIGRAHV